VNIFSKIREARKRDQVRWEKESFNEEIDTSLKNFLVTFQGNLQKLIDNTATPLEVEEATIKSFRVLGLDKSKYVIVDHVLNSLGKLNWAYAVELIMKEVTDYLAGTSEDTGDPSEAVTCATCGWSGNRSELSPDNKCPKCESVVIPVSADLPTEKKDSNLVSQAESYAIIVDKVPAIDAGLVKAKECLKILRKDKKHQTYEVLTSSGLPAWITGKSIKKVESVEVGKIYDMDWDGPSKVKVSKINSNGTCSVYRVNKNGERIPGIENQADDVKFSELTKSECLNESGEIYDMDRDDPRGKIDDRMESAEKRVTAKKYGGDDQYSWAVFIDGKPWVTGLSQSEVPYYKKKALAKLTKSECQKAKTYKRESHLGNPGDIIKYKGKDAKIIKSSGKEGDDEIYTIEIDVKAKELNECSKKSESVLDSLADKYDNDRFIKENNIDLVALDKDFNDVGCDSDTDVYICFSKLREKNPERYKYWKSVFKEI